MVQLKSVYRIMEIAALVHNSVSASRVVVSVMLSQEKLKPGECL